MSPVPVSGRITAGSVSDHAKPQRLLIRGVPAINQCRESRGAEEFDPAEVDDCQIVLGPAGRDHLGPLPPDRACGADVDLPANVQYERVGMACVNRDRDRALQLFHL